LACEFTLASNPAALVLTEYFKNVKGDPKLIANFKRRMEQKDGGAPQQYTVVRGN